VRSGSGSEGGSNAAGKRAGKRGVKRGQRELLEQLLAARFGRLPEWVSAKLAAADPARVASWARRVLTAESLEALFAEVT
jgi:hypothetical protein